MAVHGPHETAVAVASPMHPVVAEVCKVALGTLVNAMNDDGERKAVQQACDSVMEVLDHVGVAALTPEVLPPLMETISKLLNEKATCQTMAQHEVDEDEDDDHDNIVMDSVSDLIGVLSKHIGAHCVMSM